VRWSSKTSAGQIKFLLGDTLAVTQREQSLFSESESTRTPAPAAGLGGAARCVTSSTRSPGGRRRNGGRNARRTGRRLGKARSGVSRRWNSWRRRRRRAGRLDGIGTVGLSRGRLGVRQGASQRGRASREPGGQACHQRDSAQGIQARHGRAGQQATCPPAVRAGRGRGSSRDDLSAASASVSDV